MRSKSFIKQYLLINYMTITKICDFLKLDNSMMRWRLSLIFQLHKVWWRILFWNCCWLILWCWRCCCCSCRRWCWCCCWWCRWCCRGSCFYLILSLVCVRHPDVLGDDGRREVDRLELRRHRQNVEVHFVTDRRLLNWTSSRIDAKPVNGCRN